MNKRNSTWFKYHLELMGKIYYLNGSEVCKSVLYFGGYDSSEILFNRTDVTYKKRPKSDG